MVRTNLASIQRITAAVLVVLKATGLIDWSWLQVALGVLLLPYVSESLAGLACGLVSYLSDAIERLGLWFQRRRLSR